MGVAGLRMVRQSQGGRELGRGWLSGGKEEEKQYRGRTGSPGELALPTGSREL